MATGLVRESQEGPLKTFVRRTSCRADSVRLTSYGLCPHPSFPPSQRRRESRIGKAFIHMPSYEIFPGFASPFFDSVALHSMPCFPSFSFRISAVNRG